MACFVTLKPDPIDFCAPQCHLSQCGRDGIAISTAALLGRSLPRLGPFEASNGPFFMRGQNCQSFGSSAPWSQCGGKSMHDHIGKTGQIGAQISKIPP